MLMATGYVSAQSCAPAPETKACAAVTACGAQTDGCPKQGACAGCPIGIMKNAKALGLTETQTAKINRIIERAFKKVQAQLTDDQQAKAKMICGKGGCPLPDAGCKKACCAKAKSCGPACTKPCCATKVKAKACAAGCTKPCCAAKAKACCAAAAATKCGPNCTKPCCATKVKAKACAPGCTKPCCAAKAKACCAAAAEKKCGPNCTKPCCATKVKAKACAPGCTKPCCAEKDPASPKG
ncbi:MAG: hypothetical protein HQ515_17890 [Phycisphaeraceae bacterium]|nr:hypothetical protein [Phycisphaeraceae bacterium]